MSRARAPRNPEPHVLALSGAWDLSGRDELAALLFGVVRSTPQHVVLDLTDAAVVDCGCIAMIGHCAQRLRVRGGAMSIVLPSPAARRILDASGLAGAVPFFDTVDAARAPLTATPESLV
ncbi:MAG TPA: STAS domain-containing protein [Nocardioides sp.]|uniref:STAS domain-containing protein n=1 Tax=Nocardioides sp. TaxID=35761 RepID=UPI002F4216D3